MPHDEPRDLFSMPLRTPPQGLVTMANEAISIGHGMPPGKEGSALVQLGEAVLAWLSPSEIERAQAEERAAHPMLTITCWPMMARSLALG